MAITQIRYIGTGIGTGKWWGGGVSASGPYVLVSWANSSATGFWLYKRINGVLTEILNPYTPTLYPPDWSLAYWGKHTDCWYDSDNAKLEIIVSAVHDQTAGPTHGAVFFLEWPDSGLVNGDMVELGRINGEFAAHLLGGRVAICDGRAIATEGRTAAAGSTEQVSFFSRTGAVWSQDRRGTYPGLELAAEVSLWQKPDKSAVLGVVGCPLYDLNHGRIHVVKSTGPGNTWSAPKILDGAVNEFLGWSSDIDIGSGDGSIVANHMEAGPNNGVRIWDRTNNDDTNWVSPGIIKSNYPNVIATQFMSVSIGCKAVFFGHPYDLHGLNKIGGVNASVYGSSWNIGNTAEYFFSPDPYMDAEWSTYCDAIKVAYDNEHVRILSGDRAWNNTGAIIEYNADLDLPIAGAAPTVQNQSPAPASPNNRSDGDIYAEVIDTDSDLDASTVQFWVDGMPAWSGSSAATGWSGTRSAITNGYSYLFTPDNPILSGATITVRVRAEDMVGHILDTTYTFDTGIFLDSVAGMVISTPGGESMVARGLFTLSGVQVYLGPLGNNQDPLCYGGQGKGYSPASDDGVTIEFASPPLAKATVTLTVVDGATTLNLGSIKVIERSWPDALHNMRRNFAPWKALGVRRLDLENLE